MEEEKNKKLRQRSVASLKRFKTVFESGEGELVLHDLMKFSGFMSPSFETGKDGKIDPYDAAFNDGKKEMIRYIFSKMKTDFKGLEEIITKGVEHDRSSWE